MKFWTPFSQKKDVREYLHIKMLQTILGDRDPLRPKQRPPGWEHALGFWVTEV